MKEDILEIYDIHGVWFSEMDEMTRDKLIKEICERILELELALTKSILENLKLNNRCL